MRSGTLLLGSPSVDNDDAEYRSGAWDHNVTALFAGNVRLLTKVWDLLVYTITQQQNGIEIRLAYNYISAQFKGTRTRSSIAVV